MRQSLVNTRVIDLENINAINISYLSDNLTFYENETNELIIKEYMSKYKLNYLARISVSGKTLSIKNGKRPGLSWLESEIEIYLPKEYKASLNAQTASGKIIFDTNVDLADLNLGSASGLIKLKNVDTGSMYIRTTSGQIQISDVKANSTLHTTGGQIRVHSITGNTEVVSTSGRVQFDEVMGNSSIKSTSGSIRVGKISGIKQDISTNSGTVSINEMQAEVIEIRSVSGKIDVDKLYGTLHATSTSGSISISHAAGSANINTVSGSVQAHYRFVNGNILIKTTSGRVTLSVPYDLSYNFDALTNSGSIRTVFSDGSMTTSKAMSRQVGDAPECLIRINTISGSIDVSTRAGIMKKIKDLPQII